MIRSMFAVIWTIFRLAMTPMREFRHVRLLGVALFAIIALKLDAIMGGQGQFASAMAVSGAAISVPRKPGKASQTRASGKGNKAITSETIAEESKAAEMALRNQILAVTDKKALADVNNVVKGVGAESGVMEIMGKLIDTLFSSDEVRKAHIEAYCKAYNVALPSKQDCPAPYRDKDGVAKLTPKREIALTYWPVAKFAHMHLRSSASATRAEQRIQMWRSAASKRTANLNDPNFKPKERKQAKRITVDTVRTELVPTELNKGVLADTEGGFITRLRKATYSKKEVANLLHAFVVSLRGNVSDMLKKLENPATEHETETAASANAPDVMETLKKGMKANKKAA